VIIGTLWPDWYTTYTLVPQSGPDPHARERKDPHAREREVLALAEVVRIGPEFSPAEQNRARAAAGRDPRLRIALDVDGCRLTQTLAAAPELVARWEDARTSHPYGWAVLTAALDLTRLGARAPLSIDLLRAAAPGYCDRREEAEAPDDWFEQALAYVTARLNGAVAALSPVGAGMGQVAGYIAGDYLIQHASGERRYARMPASTWDAAISHLCDPADTARLADSARNRLLYRYALPLYRQAADVGDGDAARQLARLLAWRGDPDEAVQVLGDRADAGDEEAAWQLACLLNDRGDLDQLRARADAGDDAAAGLLAGLLAGRGDLDALYEREDAGDEHATRWLNEFRDYELAECGDLDGLRFWADAGDGFAAGELARLLAERGDLARAEQILRDRASAGDGAAAGQLARLLAERGDLDEAEQVLRARADTGDAAARSSLADLLAEQGELDRLRGRADAGDGYAALQLAGLLAERGDLDELYARADGGDWAAASSLADLLARRGDLDALYARIDAGDGHAAKPLAELLIKQGRSEEAERLRLLGLNLDGSIAARA
jgi:thioredoxin-like negative regulator of GroEL